MRPRLPFPLSSIKLIIEWSAIPSQLYWLVRWNRSSFIWLEHCDVVTMMSANSGTCLIVFPTGWTTNMKHGPSLHLPCILKVHGQPGSSIQLRFTCPSFCQCVDASIAGHGCQGLATNQTLLHGLRTCFWEGSICGLIQIIRRQSLRQIHFRHLSDTWRRCLRYPSKFSSPPSMRHRCNMSWVTIMGWALVAWPNTFGRCSTLLWCVRWKS